MGFMKNVVTWNTMIAGYIQCGEFVRAIDLFQHMLSEEVKPSEVTMVSLLSAYAHLGALDMGEWIHGYIRTKKIKIDFFLGNALIDMCFKCGNVEVAIQVFHGLNDRSIFCWDSIIIGLGVHRYEKEAIDAFIAMEREWIKPDGPFWVGFRWEKADQRSPKTTGGARHHCFAVECEREATLASGEENEVGEGVVMAVKRFFSQIWWCGDLGYCFCRGWRRKEK
ncbi:hypothetical protein H5410_020654 [Solanum commersonii]|uniref:Pentatricopeptide repeat-containing protein n=1 Tax=Solanum commersonii TaxID=4109 RepID=A0A9J5ZAL1_SOLCO|nr:hypothetical protein H5410_020654 [Solanum commersonii]